MLAVIDNLDDRREIVRLIGELSPLNRYRWLGWVVSYLKMDIQITDNDRRQLEEATRGIESGNKFVTNFVYWNAMQAAVQSGINLTELVVSLEALARKKLTIEDLSFPEVINAIRTRAQGYRRLEKPDGIGPHTESL